MRHICKIAAECVIKLMRLLVWFYYSTIRISGRERIPGSGSVLFVANHANSLFDPVILGLTTKQRIRFLAKGPIFEIPLFGKLIEALGMIPVFRSQDDRSQVKRNLESLGKAADALANGQAVGIFPEGKSHDSRALESVFAGTSRIILQALKSGADSLKIVPVGINYDDKQLFRSVVWVQIGDPIEVKPLVEAAGGAAKAKRRLTDEIANSLKKVIIHLDAPEWEPFLEELEILDPEADTPDGHPVFSLRQRKIVAESLNYFRATEPEKVSSVGRALMAHRTKLERFGLRVRSEILRFDGPRRIGRLLWKSIRLSFGFLPVVAGTLQNAIPLFVERGIVTLLPKSNQSTTALSRLVVGLPVFVLWYGMVWWWMSHYFLPWVAWFWALVTPFAGLFALRFWRSLKSVALAWWAEIRMLFARQALADLRAMQEKLRQRIRKLSDAYSHLRPSLEPKKLPIYRRPLLRAGVITTLLAVAVGFLVTAGLRVGFRNHTLDALTAPAFDFSKIDTETLESDLDDDANRLAGVLSGLQILNDKAVQLASEFDSGQRSYTNDTDTDAMRQIVVTYQNCRRELLRFIWKYRETQSIPDDGQRLQASLLGLTAGSTLYQYSQNFVRMFDAHPEAKNRLNESDPFWGIPEGLYDTISKNLHNRKNLEALAEMLAWYRAKVGSNAFAGAGLRERTPYHQFHAVIARTGEIEEVGNALEAWVEEISTMGREIIYNGQSLVSTMVGNARVRKQEPKVTREQLEEMRRLLKPGDILIERQDWFLSRAVMPGYWAHAALYVGSAADLAKLGLQDHEWVSPHWDKFKQPTANGDVANILEAVPQGVRMTTLEHCIGVADSAAILRPQGITENELKEVIARAFRHLGKPYDFEFDFHSADKLVCTELVFRAYSESPSLHLPLVHVMGRETLPPSQLAQKFADDYKKPDCQLQLVLFLDGHAGGKSARRGSAADFAETAKRPGLTWLNEMQ